MEISVVIPNYNGEKVLPVALDSLQGQRFKDFETVVVDNGSSDSSVPLMERSYPWVRIVRLPCNLGFAGGVNEGIRRTISPFVALLNSDVEVDPGWLQELWQSMRRESAIGACQPKMLRYFERDRIDVIGLRLSSRGIVEGIGKGEKDGGQYEIPRFVFGVNAGAALYRRAMLDQIGLFDEHFVTSFEDGDLSFRSQLAGWSALYVPTSVAYHMVGSTRKQRKYRGTYLNNRNKILLFWKNMPAEVMRDRWRSFLSYQAGTLVRRAAFGFYKVRTFHFLRGVFAAYLSVGYLRRARKMVQSTARINPRLIASFMDRDFL